MSRKFSLKKIENNISGVSASVQQVKLLPVHILVALVLIQLPANVLGKWPNYLSPAVQLGDLGGVLGFWFPLGPQLTIVAIGRVS